MTKTCLIRILAAVLLYGTQAVADDAAAPPADGTPRRPPWGDGPPPWIKDGKVDEAARQAWLAKRATAVSRQADAARPPADASPEERRAYWQKRATERSVAAGPAATDGQESGQEARRHAAGRPVDEAAPAAGARAGSAPRWGGTREATLWLTDAPPSRAGRPGGWRGAGGMAGMGEMSAMAEGDRGGVPKKRVWLRLGGNPLTARPVTGEETALLLAPGGKASELPVEPHGGPYNVTFPTPELGYYNVYLIRRAVAGDGLDVTVAKTEVVRGEMGRSGGTDPALVAVVTDARVPVEIVRERKDKEGLFTRINYGDTVVFRVLRAGRPVQNARVSFTSGRGWSNSVQSDEDGRAAFVVIRDYYPDSWRLFDKRHRETYLVAASFATPEAGEYQGGRYASTRYLATLSGAYYPGVADYESYASGLMIGLIGLLFTGTGVWLYRRRRVKPFREVQFDD
jgi:hypothetical protein